MKTSIRFYDDREVRAIWDDSASKWWFSVLDIVAAINRESDYAKTRNYWKYLKAKLKKEDGQLVSATTQLKLRAPDGKAAYDLEDRRPRDVHERHRLFLLLRRRRMKPMKPFARIILVSSLAREVRGKAKGEAK